MFAKTTFMIASVAALILSASIPAKATPSESSPLSVTLTQHRTQPYLFKVAFAFEKDGKYAVDRRLLQIEAEQQSVTTLRSGKTRTKKKRVASCINKKLRKTSEMLSDETAGQTQTQWFDIRELCSDKNVRAMSQEGVVITARYGLSKRPARGKDLFIGPEANEAVNAPTKGRSKKKRRWRKKRKPGVSLIEVNFAEPPRFGANTESAISSDQAAVPLLKTSYLKDPASGTFSLELRGGADKSKKVYSRDDLYSLIFSHPVAGEFTCAPRRVNVNPIVDFFSTISKRRAVRHRVSLTSYCHPALFAAPGVYEVQAQVDLPYDGKRFGFEAITGEYAGPKKIMRVGGYRAQPIEQLPEDIRDGF